MEETARYNAGGEVKGRTITIEIAVPSGARWRTTDEDGRVTFWGNGRKPELIKGVALNYWIPAESTKMFEATAKELQYTHTGIPCPDWETSLVELEPDGA